MDGPGIAELPYPDIGDMGGVLANGTGSGRCGTLPSVGIDGEVGALGGGAPYPAIGLKPESPPRYPASTIPGIGEDAAPAIAAATPAFCDAQLVAYWLLFGSR
jgi:hypothetical protein